MKNFLLAGICLVFANFIYSQSIQGPYSSTTIDAVPIPGSNQTWISLTGAAPSDDIYATFGNLTGGVGSYTDYLVATNFGFTIPGGATITGIFVEVETLDPTGNTSDYSVRIVKAKNIGTTEKALGTTYSTSDAYLSYGNPADLWDETWTADDINDEGFGIAISAQRNSPGGNTEGQVDDIRITVYYEFITLPVKLVNFSANKNKNAIDVNWTVTEEINMSHYEVERSSDGRNFSSITSITSQNNVNQFSYTANDNNPASGIAYYRLKMVDNDNYIKYSRIVSVQFSTGNQVSLYPAFWKKGTNLNINNPNREQLTVYFVNSMGQTTATRVSESSIITSDISKNLNGIIHYKIVNAEGTVLGTGNLMVR